MAFNISEFRAQMVGDGARANLFEVTMPFPSFAGATDAGKKFTFMCKSASLPGSTIGTVPLQYFGRELKFAGNRTFADWSVNVINDEDFAIRNSFERWMSGMNSHNLNVRNPIVTNPSTYTVDALVKQYSKNGDVLKNYRFVGLFPTDISPIEVDWGSNDSIEEFSVSFAYQWWDSIDSGVV